MCAAYTTSGVTTTSRVAQIDPRGARLETNAAGT
jgi:hypothetical protein